MTRAEVVLLTLVAYKVALVLIGLWAERRTKDGTDFFLGGRRLGPTVAAISASASSSSAWTLLGVSGAAYADGLSAIWLFPACVGGFLLNWYVLAPALRRVGRARGAVTLTDVLAADADRLDEPGSGRDRRLVGLASLIVLFSLTAYVASQYQAAGISLEEQFDVTRTGAIWIGAGVVLLYTLLGGFWAVSVTDTLQGFVMAATAVILPVAALIAVGGPSGLAEMLFNSAPAGYLNVTKPGPTSLVIGSVLGLLGVGLGYPGQPHVVNRFMALQSGADALRKARRIAIAWAVVVYSGMLLLGYCGRALHPTIGNGETIFIVVMEGLFHPLVVGVMLAAVLSAIMSTADSQLLVAASAVTHDLARPDDPGSRDALFRNRVAVAAVGLLAIVFALEVDAKIFRNVLFAWSALGAAFGPILLLQVVLHRRLAPSARLLVMGTGFTLSVGAYLLTDSERAILDPKLRWFWSGFAAFLAAFVVGSVASRPAHKTQNADRNSPTHPTR